MLANRADSARVLVLVGEAVSFPYRKRLANNQIRPSGRSSHNRPATGFEFLGQLDPFFAILDHERVVFSVS